MIRIEFYVLWRLRMTWTEVKIEGYDFCLESGEWQIRRKKEQVGIWFSPDGEFDKYTIRMNWCDNVADGMFKVWSIELSHNRKNEKN